jgi:hypothetical protein
MLVQSSRLVSHCRGNGVSDLPDSQWCEGHVAAAWEFKLIVMRQRNTRWSLANPPATSIVLTITRTTCVVTDYQLAGGTVSARAAEDPG